MLLTNHPIRLAVLGLVALFLPARPAPAVPAEVYGVAVSMLAADDYPNARATAQQIGDPLFERYVRWVELARSDAAVWFEDAASFLREAPGWPRLQAIRRNAEQAMPYDIAPAEVLAFFSAWPPLTARGKYRHAEALRASGDAGGAASLVRRIWREEPLDPDLETEILALYGPQLTAEDQVARLDNLLWAEEVEAARRQAARVGGDYRLLAEARIRLLTRAPGVDAAVIAVPARLQGDPGLLYDRARWRRTAGQFSGVVELLDAAPAAGARAEAWWPMRRWALLQAFADRNYDRAYRLAYAHGAASGRAFREGEWYAGWIALRFLNDPARALQHFARLHAGVDTPISKARGAYWSGRAAEAMGDRDGAGRWYQNAAADATTFYGQLAAHRSGSRLAPSLTAAAAPSAAERAAFDGHELVRLVRLLGSIGERRRAIPFLTHIGEAARTAGEGQLAADLAMEQGLPGTAMFIARRLRTRDIVLPDRLFPVLELAGAFTLEPAYTLAIIRQESGFDPEAVSRAGARGLMQLMPATAQQVSRRVGAGYSLGSLTADPQYNVMLGQSYLQQMLDRYGGSRVLATAAYNAGPGNVDRWLGIYGDPRYGVDVLDWIESIPYEETQNYVQRVFEALHVYRYKLDPSKRAVAIAPELLAAR